VKVLIFGARGQVGRALAETAPPAAELILLDRNAADITRKDQVDAVVAAAAPEIVFNAAAFTAVDGAEQEPEAAELVNGSAPGWIAAASRRAGSRFLHISTDYVFDGSAGRPWRTDDACNPLSVYGRTKLQGEDAALGADPEALIVRTAWVYAPGGRNFVLAMLRLMRERPSLAVVADQIGTPTYARSLAAALWSLAAAGVGGIHHFTAAGVASWYDFAFAIQEEALAAGLIAAPVEIMPINSEDYPTPARRPLYTVLDKSPTWAVLGRPAPHWRVDLRACMAEIARFKPTPAAT
jgi:dTDP-4-dehydrorhamnose reductase